MRLFISYRRRDTEGYVLMLSSVLQQARLMPPIDLFVDADKIPTGTDFVQRMLDAVKSCDAVLACIGPEWRGHSDGSSKGRLFVKDDPVRVELATAFSKKVPVFVALLGGAQRPSRAQLPDDLAPLVDIIPTSISDERFEEDMLALVARIRAKVQPPDRAPVAPAKIAMAAAEGLYLSSVELLIDGKSAGRFLPKSGRVAEFVVTPGAHTVQTKVDWSKSNAITVNAQAGRTVQVVFKPGWKMKLEPGG